MTTKYVSEEEIKRDCLSGHHALIFAGMTDEGGGVKWKGDLGFYYIPKGRSCLYCDYVVTEEILVPAKRGDHQLKLSDLDYLSKEPNENHRMG